MPKLSFSVKIKSVNNKCPKKAYRNLHLQSKSKGKSSGHSKKSSSSGDYPDYHDVTKVVNIESYWTQMEEIVDNQKKFFQHHINVRSTNALDDLLVDLEGDLHPLKEVANINKKDPKRLVVDMSSFPQATVSAMDALRYLHFF